MDEVNVYYQFKKVILINFTFINEANYAMILVKNKDNHIYSKEYRCIAVPINDLSFVEKGKDNGSPDISLNDIDVYYKDTVCDSGGSFDCFRFTKVIITDISTRKIDKNSTYFFIAIILKNRERTVGEFCPKEYAYEIAPLSNLYFVDKDIKIDKNGVEIA